MGCISVSQADSADKEGLSKWAIFMLLITKETAKIPPFQQTLYVCVCVGACVCVCELMRARLCVDIHLS